MPIAIYTSEADDDLGRIVQYIAQDNLFAALTWLDTTRATCDLLATQPARYRTTYTNQAIRGDTPPCGRQLPDLLQTNRRRD
jgi:plasmid stabilization system protein ParE